MSQSDAELISIYMEKYAKIFYDMDLVQSSIDISELKNLRLADPNHHHLKVKFETFLENVQNEYAKNDDYKKKCITLLDRIIGVAIKTDSIKFHNTITDSHVSMKERTTVRNVWHKLVSILVENSGLDEERQLILLNMVYLGIVEGVFEEDIKACYAWSKLAVKEPVDYGRVESMKINNIYEYFRDCVGDTCLFEGYNRNLRNAIAHFAYEYESSSKNMIYTDKPANWTMPYTRSVLTKLIGNLYDLDELIMILLFELAIRDLCFAKTLPWKEKDYL